MATIDLTTPAPTPEGILEGLPRRVALTLPELRVLAARAGDAPLPFELVEPEAGGNAFESRLGQSRLARDDEAYVDALATLNDPADSLTKRGLIAEGVADSGIIGALGLLATPSVAVDIDVTLAGARARAWHRQRDDAVATLATTDGLVFELAWFGRSHWADELARVAVLPEDITPGTSNAPDVVDLPYELLDAGAEAIRSGRTELLGTIIAHHTGDTRDASGQPVDDATVSSLISALSTETQGRLRAMVASINGADEADSQLVGVVSWVLLADGWRVLHPHQEGAEHRVEVRRVEATDLAMALAPVLAEVTA
ncbi:MAG: hypothetical protein L0H93_06525 [Nocardioides sp.]|nr:hypothetical protein [Nocardioides sp.]